eukprot:scpid52695/ scgid25562/ 
MRLVPRSVIKHYGADLSLLVDALDLGIVYLAVRPIDQHKLAHRKVKLHASPLALWTRRLTVSLADSERLLLFPLLQRVRPQGRAQVRYEPGPRGTLVGDSADSGALLSTGNSSDLCMQYS